MESFNTTVEKIIDSIDVEIKKSMSDPSKRSYIVDYMDALSYFKLEIKDVPKNDWNALTNKFKDSEDFAKSFSGYSGTSRGDIEANLFLSKLGKKVLAQKAKLRGHRTHSPVKKCPFKLNFKGML